ncbi:arylamine N-acetyltransferase [Paenibacillus athensensis]|uniref:Arylamine N-acetyltransferase n=1 Tax=Paenibacillus athensensis TaxID=1967502 RepID=A0A4Y8Q059_9BACL|nr:arylamine N-acetyltransferase [Paenibacillus athensensis]MCD1261131.1 arylamine N-acetyltransferase [Paenibacillus athensensis]
MRMLTEEQVRAYLQRLGVAEAQPPSRAFLFELHRAHVERLPWETIDIFAGRPAAIDVRQSVELMTGGRSGYCFHLNGAFGALLRTLGYQVRWHRGGVQPKGEAPRINGFHLGMTVELPEEPPGERIWLVDVGLGDMPYEPLPMQFGDYAQGPLTYGLTASGEADNGWRLVHDPLGAFSGVDYAPDVVPGPGAFERQHEMYSTSADSPWINLFLVRQRHATGSNELRGCMWNRRGPQGMEATELRTMADWLGVLGDVFGEKLVRYSALEREALWNKTLALHETWKRAKGR